MNHLFKKIIIVLPLLVITGVAFVGCGSKDNGSTASAPVPAPVAQSSVPSTFSQNTWTGSLSIKNQNLFQQYLQDNNICNPNYFYFTIGYPNYSNYSNCSNYSAIGATLSLQSVNGSAYGVVMLYSKLNGYSNYITSTYLDGIFQPFDNYAGYELMRRGYDGTLAWNASIRYRFYGAPTQSTLRFQAWYRNSAMAEGQLTLSNSVHP